MTNPLQVLETALKKINPNCDEWYSHDTYISWADLMKAIRTCLDTEDTPDPKPEPLSASEALMRAHMRADEPESSILWTVVKYAESHPEWFRGWHDHDDPGNALEAAQRQAYFDDMTAWLVLSAAKRIAAYNPALFGGE